jgi:hypothetical protein
VRGVRKRLKQFAGLVGLVCVVRALATPLGRGRLRAGRYGARLLQPTTVTRMDRRPVLFSRVSEWLTGQDAPRLLSFGCSTGEKAVTLAHYLPGARIDAIDANPACIAKARRTADRLGLGQITFACADVPDAVMAEGYDAVFCLIVKGHRDLDLAAESGTARLHIPIATNLAWTSA